MNKILLIDDEPDIVRFLRISLKADGYQVIPALSGAEGLEAFAKDKPEIVITDIKMPGMDGIEVLEKIKIIDPNTEVIIITGHGDVPMSVRAMKAGAVDFLEKPFNPDRMTELAKKAANARRLTLDNRALRRELSDGGSGIIKKLVGASPVMERLREDILDLGQADGHVLIDGETGTGKTLAFGLPMLARICSARALRAASRNAACVLSVSSRRFASSSSSSNGCRTNRWLCKRRGKRAIWSGWQTRHAG